MSNGINSPYGLVAVESISGDGATRKMKHYQISVNNDGTTNIANSIYRGDPVCYPRNQALNSFVGGTNLVPAISSVVNADTTVALWIPSPIVGVFIGCSYTQYNSGRVTESSYWPGNNFRVQPGTEVIFYVNDDPDTIFKIQMSTCNDNTVPASGNLGNYSPIIFQNWMVGQNAMVGIGGFPITAALNINNQPIPNYIPGSNPASAETNGNVSAVYLDGYSIGLAFAGSVPIPGVDNEHPYVQTAAAPQIWSGGGSGNGLFSVKIVGLAPSSYRTMASVGAPEALSNLLPGAGMPFCDLLVKINNHIYSVGSAGPFNKSA